MHAGARVTDEVHFYQRLGDYRQAARVVRRREPERLRWRTALSTVSQIAGGLRGRERMCVEEPTREMVLDLEDRVLRREAVLDARLYGVDMDRGEVLPHCDRWELCRSAYLTGVDLAELERYVRLPGDYGAPLDVAAVALVGRHLAEQHRARAQSLLERLPSGRLVRDLRRHERFMLQRAKSDADLARRWGALARHLVRESA